jgi:tetratricopeptide (TPR) repeat protein
MNIFALRVFGFCALWQCAIICALCAQPPADLFKQGNDAYTKGDFSPAISFYEQAAAQERRVSPELLYNLGNAYYRENRPGKAMLCWERALKYAPRDKDIRDNIRFAQSRLFTDNESRAASEIIIGWLQGLATVNEIAVACLIVFVIGMALLIMYSLTRRRVWGYSAIAAACVLLCVGLWAGLIYRFFVMRTAIIVAPTAEVRNGPAETFNVGFTVTEGRRAVLLRVSGDWQEIGIPSQGLKGWVTKEQVEQI